MVFLECPWDVVATIHLTEKRRQMLGEAEPGPSLPALLLLPPPEPWLRPVERTGLCLPLPV